MTFKKDSLAPTERRIYDALKSLDGFGTDHEIVERSGVPLSVVNAARNGLMQKGLVRDSGRTKLNRRTHKRNRLWELIRQDDPGPREPRLF